MAKKKKKKAAKKRVSKATRMAHAAEARLKVCKHIQSAAVEIDKVVGYLKKIPKTEKARAKARRAAKLLDELLDHCG